MADKESSLLPKSGEETSSYKITGLSLLLPILLMAVVVAGLIFIEEPRVREVLVQAMLYVVAPSILGAAAVGVQYVNKRGAVSVAKLEAYTAVNAPQPQTSTGDIVGNKVEMGAKG